MRRPRTLLLAAALAVGLVAALPAEAAAGAAATTGTSSAAPALRTATVAARTLVERAPTAARLRHRTKVIMPLRRAGALPRGTRTARITYHGGAVLSGTVHVYLIWYGTWSGRPAVPLLTDLVSGFGGSPYAATNAAYTDKAGHHASTDVQYAVSITDGYSHGRRLSDAGVKQVVLGAIRDRRLPADDHGIYVVLTSADVKETSGFGTRYCGWHSRTTTHRTPIRYVFAGDPSTQAPRGCEAPTPGSPNDDRGADALASTLVHEIDETLTDPDLDAWYDRYGNENADKCAWTYGFTYTAGNGATANVRLGGHDFLVQQNWVARSPQGCALS